MSLPLAPWRRVPRSKSTSRPAVGSVAPVSVFAGYPAALLVRWCRVSAVTARLYKSGVRRPSKAVLRLFILHRDQQVLTEAWAGWRIAQDRLVSPEGVSLAQGQLRAYQQVYALAYELARRGSADRERLDRIVAAVDAA